MDKQTVLIAGDDTGSGRTLAAQLLQEGYEVIESPDATHALQTWQKVHPELLVLCPSQDGTWDGLDLLHEIRHREEGLSLVLISYHGPEDAEIRERCARMNDRGKSPASSDDLLTSIVHALSSPFATPCRTCIESQRRPCRSGR